MSEWKFDGFGHGADYNPDQWRHIPGTLDADIRLMKLAKCNIMSVGIFSWAALEPEEGRFDFAWLDEVIDKLHTSGISVMLATPGAARPAWMSIQYPEVLRVNADGRRILHSARHNHCYTSPVYQQFVRRINAALAERYGKHPGVVGWHINNEYNGYCYCDLCEAEFRKWLERKYGTIENLNHAWWTGFWAKAYDSFDQIRAPFEHGERGIHGLNLDWRRFSSDRTADFMAMEVEPIRKQSDLPVTTNTMGTYVDVDCFRLTRVMDVASHDLYPAWGGPEGDFKVAVRSALAHDITRSLLRKPFLLMESTPSMVNWQNVNRPKRPGMHLLSSIQAVAHGADTVQYFQWRKSRGASEKLHGAVVDYVGHEHTRVFRDVTDVGEWLVKMAPAAHGTTRAQAALIFDWENRWAIADAQGPKRDKQHDEICMEHYEALLRQGVNVDVIDSVQPFDPYKLIIAPMLYMIRPGVAERLEAFVEAGGTLVATYWTGIVDENDLCFLGGFPGPLRKLLGVWSEEIDALYPDEVRHMTMQPGNALKLSGEVECNHLLDLCHAEGAEVIAEYADDFYAGRPALTRNAFGQGHAWYIAARTGTDFLTELYGKAIKEAGILPLVPALPKGMLATERMGQDAHYLFLMNFEGGALSVHLPRGHNAMTGEAVGGETVVAGKTAIVVKTKP